MRWRFSAKTKKSWLVFACLFLGLAAWFVLSPSRKSNEWLSVPTKTREAEILKSKQVTPAQRGRFVYEKYGCGMCHGNDAKKGIKNPNSQTDEIPGLIYVKESYLPKELQTRILDGIQFIPPKDPQKSLPPYRMPGWRGWMMDQEVNDLCEYLFSLMPEEAKEEEW